MQWAEEYLSAAGLDGRGCLLRAVCETHLLPPLGHGMLGEVIDTILT